MSLYYTDDLHRLFLEAVENVCWQNVIFGIKGIRVYQPMTSREWVARKDVVRNDGEVISVRMVVENGCFFIKEIGLKKESDDADSSGRSRRVWQDYGGSGGGEGSGNEGWH